MSYLYTKTEKIISELWEELEVANNDRENNFFASGGDSISLIRLSILIKERFGVDVGISELLQYPLLHEMANYIDSQIKTIIPECHKQIFNKDSVIPLSSSQRGIWYQMELDSEKENKNFNIPLVFRVLGRVDITRLNYSFKEIIKRHRVINSSISDTNGYPGIVLKENEIKISVIDVSELSNNEKEEKFSEIKFKEQNKVIDIKSGPLFFVSIIKYSEELYYMFITSHHMIFDGVSYDILLKELIEIYQGNQLEDLKLDYLDYAIWENSDEYQSYLEDGLTYWQLRLDSFRPMELPYKYITSSTEKDNSSLFFDLTAEQVSELNVLARKHNTTLYTVFVVALQIVLNEFKTTGDIAFGTYVSNRHLAEFNSVIGNFVNPLLLRFDYNEEHTISNALIATHEQITQDFIRQHIPFESIVKKMNPDRKKGEHSLFEFTFIYNNSIFEGKYENEYLSIESCNHQLEELETNRTDIEFWVRPNLKSGGFQCELNIQVNKVNKRFAKILLESINHILINFIEQHSDTTLNELALFPSSYEYSELHSAAYEFNNYPLTQLIRDNASKSPNKIAIVDGDIEYSYAYLEEKSNCIARGLNELKSTPSPIIGVLLPYGIDLVISCLSILKCGGIIFLLDINESSERIESILDESECKFIITNSDLLDDINNDTPCLLINELLSNCNRNAEEAFNIKETLVTYMIHTSGSSGNAKLLLNKRYGLLNRIYWFNELNPFYDDDKFLLKTSVSFVDFYAELFLPLVLGKILYIANDDIRRHPEDLIAYIIKNNINNITLTPSVILEMYRVLQENNIYIMAIRKLISSGEVLSLNVVNKIKKYIPKAKVFNIYGSSEMSADLTCYNVIENEKNEIIPAGKLVFNSKAMIVNKKEKPIAKGLVGELWVTGSILCDGYLKANAKQRDNFFYNNDELWYKTGDYAYLNSKNELVVIGRKDDRKKVRGILIDLKEIDRVLLSCDGVGQCLSSIVTDSNDEKILAVLLELSDGRDKEYVYAQLNKKLPKTHIPSLIVSINKIPTLLGGKIDKIACTTILQDSRYKNELTAKDIIPETLIEQELEQIWKSLLGFDGRISIDQNFFRLGGHSLLASRLLSIVRTKFSIDINLSDIFDFPTIKGIASLISESEKDSVNIDKIHSENNLYDLSFNQQRLFYLQSIEPKSISYNMTFSLTMIGHVDLSKLTFSLNELINRHDALRSRFIEVVDDKGISEFKVFVNDSGYIFPIYKVVGQRDFEQAIKDELYEQHHIPFDLSQSPLMRVTLIDTKQEKSAIVICMHHIIADGWSIAILFKELSELYNGKILKSLPYRHVDYANWLNNRIGEDSRKSTLKKFWKNYLQNDKGGKLFNKDISSDRNISKVVRRRCSLNINEIIDSNYKNLNIDPYDIILTTFACVLAVWKNVNHYFIGTVSAGRHLHSESENILGFLANTIPVKIDIDPNLGFNEILLSLVSERRNLLKYQDLPFDEIVNSASTRKMGDGISSLMQVMCVHQNIDYRDLDIQGVDTHVEAYLGESEAKFELVLQTAQIDSRTLDILVEYNDSFFKEYEVVKLIDMLLMLLNSISKNEKLIDIKLNKRNAAYQKTGDIDIPKCFPKTLPEFLKLTAKNHSTNGITIIDDYGTTFISYNELYEKSVQFAKKLNNSGLKSGDVIILIPEKYNEYFCLLWGAILARIIPITVAKPLDFESDDNCYKLIDACRLFDYSPIVTNGELVSEMTTLCQRHKKIKFLNIQLSAQNKDFKLIEPLPEDTAFYQLTSGSTGKSKAINQRHEALASYVFLSGHARDYNEKNILLNWLPMDHIGPLWLYHMRAVCVGSNQIHISTPLILEKPLLWLELISKYQVTHSWAPNFAYKLVINEMNKSFDSNLSIDLSSLKELVTGGEMVSGLTLKSFSQLLKPLGLNSGVLTPSFGMAESCTCITYGHEDDPEISINCLNFNEQNSIQAGSSLFTSLGKVIPGVEIRIVDDTNSVLEEFQVGHYQIRGPNVTNGYYKQKDLNNSVFTEDGWFDSGDNGFIANGNLYLVGRTKEMLIANGKNYFCHEIEEQLEQIKGIESTYIAAFSIKKDDQEEIVVCYVPNGRVAVDIINTEISQLLFKSIGLYINKIIPLQKCFFLKTTSGKIQRAKMAQKCVDGELTAITQSNSDRLNLINLDWVVTEHTENLQNMKWLSVGDAIDTHKNIKNIPLSELQKSLETNSYNGIIFGRTICENEGDLLEFIDLIINENTLKDITLCCVTDNEQMAGLIYGLLTSISSESSLKHNIVIQKKSSLDLIFPKNLDSGWYKQSHQYQLEKLTDINIGNIKNISKIKNTEPDDYVVITGAGGAIAQLIIKKIMPLYKNIILIGRSDEPEYVIKNRDKLTWIKTDCSDLKSLIVTFKSFLHKKPPKYVYHLAGIFEPSFLKEISVEKLNKARIPKVFAIENLRKTMSILYPTSCKNIQFKLFGSVAVFKSSPMLGPYIAANSELLGYAQDKRNNGYSMSWIGWSAWEGIGMGKGQDRDLLHEIGLQLVDKTEGINVLMSIKDQNKDFLIGISNRSSLEEVAISPSVNEERSIDNTLASLIKSILSIDDVNFNDNFFELGLTSIDLTRLHRSINNTLNINISLVDILQFSTLRKLSTHIIQLIAENDE